jgi:hypothetical protein
VPSLAIAQSVAFVLAGYGKNRLRTLAVFGVLVWYLKVTVFVASIAHAPVNVAMRNVLRCCDGGTVSNRSGASARSPISTRRTALAIRSADERSKITGSATLSPPALGA